MTSYFSEFETVSESDVVVKGGTPRSNRIAVIKWLVGLQLDFERRQSWDFAIQCRNAAYDVATLQVSDDVIHRVVTREWDFILQ